MNNHNQIATLADGSEEVYGRLTDESITRRTFESEHRRRCIFGRQFESRRIRFTVSGGRRVRCEQFDFVDSIPEEGETLADGSVAMSITELSPVDSTTDARYRFYHLFMVESVMQDEADECDLYGIGDAGAFVDVHFLATAKEIGAMTEDEAFRNAMIGR